MCRAVHGFNCSGKERKAPCFQLRIHLSKPMLSVWWNDSHWNHSFINLEYGRCLYPCRQKKQGTILYPQHDSNHVAEDNGRPWTGRGQRTLCAWASLPSLLPHQQKRERILTQWDRPCHTHCYTGAASSSTSLCEETASTEPRALWS